MINSKFLKIMLLIFILFSAIAGQIQYAFYKAELKGSIYYLISFINIILLYALLRKKGAENTNKTIEDITENAKKPELHKNPLFAHPALKIISFTLFVIILYQAYSLTDNIISILIWLCMLFLFILSFLKIKLYDIPNKLKNIIYNIKTRDAVLFFIILITAIVFRVYNLEKIPLEVNQEEGFASVGALEVLSGVLKGPFDFGPKSAPGWTYYSGLYYYGHAFFIKIFGNSIIGNRMFAAIAGILCVPVTMLFTKEAAGKKTAYLAGFLVAVFGVHIHFSRFGFMFIHSALWGILALYMILVSDRKKSPYLFAITGIVIGISQYTWTAARILPIIFTLFFIYKLFSEKGYIKSNYKNLIILSTGFIISFLPLILPLHIKLPNFLEGAPRDFIFGGFMSEINPGINSIGGYIKIFIEYFKRAFLAFNFYPDKGYLYAGASAMLPFLTSVFFMIGLFYTIIKVKKPANMLLIISFFLSIAVLVALTTHSPNYQRMAVILCLPPVFAGIGIKQVFKNIKKIINKKTIILLILLMSFLLWENYNDYFNKYSKNKDTDITTKIGYYLKDLEESYDIYIPNPAMHVPWVLDIMDNDNRNINFKRINDMYLMLDKSSKKSVVILMEWNKGHKDEILKKYPGARVEVVKTLEYIDIIYIE